MFSMDWLSVYEITSLFFPCCSLLLHMILVLWLDNVLCVDMLIFPIFSLCKLKCYPHNTHHPTQIYCTLLIGKFNRFNTYKLIQTTHTNHTYDSIIRIIHIYDTMSRCIIYPYPCILVLLVYYFIQIHYIHTPINKSIISI